MNTLSATVERPSLTVVTFSHQSDVVAINANISGPRGRAASRTMHREDRTTSPGLLANPSERPAGVAHPPSTWHLLVGEVRRSLSDYRLLLALTILGGFGLRIWDIGRRSLWFDELFSVSVAGLGFDDFLPVIKADANSPLYYVLLAVWLRIVGADASDALIRLPSAVAGTLSILVCFFLGRRLHSTRTGLLAAALLAGNRYHILWSQEARAYAGFTLLVLLSYLVLDLALTGGQRRRWVLHGVVTASALHFHVFAAFIVLAQVLIIISRRSRPAIGGGLLSGLVASLLVVGWIPHLSDQAGGARQAWLPPPTLESVASMVVQYSSGGRAACVLSALLIVVGLCVLRDYLRLHARP
jgi:4-amino-4-deoxy-L-arabinose transferase-like glycosyltransferase